MMSLIGDSIGIYQILELIGAGGMATVYKGLDPTVDRHVAVKVLPAFLVDTPVLAENFTRVAERITALAHRHILPVRDYGLEQGTPFLVTPLIKAGSLWDRITQPRLSFDEATRYFCQIVEAVDFAHKQGILHGNLTNNNALLDENGRIYVSDFGLTQLFAESSAKPALQVIGTPAYMSPEQGQGQDIDERSDIYALGIMLYEMLLGEVPFISDTAVAILFKHIRQPVPKVRSKNPDLPEEVEAIILKALAKNPDMRFQTVAEMVDALQEADLFVSAPHPETLITEEVETVPPAVSTDNTPLPDRAEPPISATAAAVIPVLDKHPAPEDMPVGEPATTLSQTARPLADYAQRLDPLEVPPPSIRPRRRRRRMVPVMLMVTISAIVIITVLSSQQGSITTVPTASDTSTASPEATEQIVDAETELVTEETEMPREELEANEEMTEEAEIPRATTSRPTSLAPSASTARPTSPTPLVSTARPTHTDPPPTASPIPATLMSTEAPVCNAMVVSNYELVNMRTRPDIEAGIATVVPAGAAVEVIARNTAGDWYQVIYEDVDGWMAAALLTLRMTGCDAFAR